MVVIFNSSQYRGKPILDIGLTVEGIIIWIRLALAWATVAVGFFGDIFPSFKGEFMGLLIAF